MVYNAGNKIANLTGKILSARGAVGVKKPKRLTQRRQAVAGNCPVSNLKVNGLRAHIVDVLGVIFSCHDLFDAGKLPLLKDDVADAALTNPCVFTAGGADPVHDNACNGAHTIIPLTACFALHKPCKQLSVRKCHCHFHSLSARNFSDKNGLCSNTICAFWLNVNRDPVRNLSESNMENIDGSRRGMI